MAEDTTKEPVIAAEAISEETSGTVATPVVETTEAPKPVAKKKSKRSVPFGHVHIMASFNNTIITVTDPKGATLTFSSAGSNGFRGSKKGTAYAAQVAAEKAIGEAKQFYGLSKADVFVKGIGLGREAAIRALQTVGVAIEGVHDVTGVPHGGVRPKKARRV
jgi:small subunit ribosomal protein S11